MSKHIRRIPLETVERIAVIFGGGRSMAQCKGDADYIMNGGFYDMSTGNPVGHLKVAGKVYAKADWSCYGFTWGGGADIRMDVIPDKGGDSYFSGVELLSPYRKMGADLHYLPEVGGSRPRTAMALSAGELILYCADSPVTPEKLRDELYAVGAESALMLDSGGSTQCDFGEGAKVSSSRRVNNYIAVWLKKTGGTPEGGENKMIKKVVLDPGHGVETPGKCSPDGSYCEYEFNLDVALQIKEHLERHGVAVTLTRADEHEVGATEKEALAARVATSNAVKPNLFVSIHSNAYGNGAEWTEPEGYDIYTAVADDTAERNKAAKAILARVKEAGIKLHGNGLHHERFYVLRNTVAPAVLIEHGFHTNLREVELLKNGTYRALLAEADAKGILDYLGVAWQGKAVTGAVCPHCGGKLTIGKG